MTPRRTLFFLFLVLLAALAVRLVLTSPLGHDDVEHLHTAWLVSQGDQPFLDFFQKQSPLFWALLQPAAWLAQGDLLAFVLLGRLCMLAGLFATAAGLLALGRLVARSSRTAWVAPFMLLASPTLLYNLIAIRPDGIMAAAVVWAVVLLGWRRPVSCAAAGFLFGLASVLLLKAVPSAVVLSLAAAALSALLVPVSAASPAGHGNRDSGSKAHLARRLTAALKTLALVAAGGFAAVAPFLLWLRFSGLLEGFWFTNVVFNGWLYASPLAEDVPRASRLATLLLAMLRNEPWLPVAVAAGFLLLPGRLVHPRLRSLDPTASKPRGPSSRESVVLLLLLLSLTNLLLLIPNHLPFYSYLLLPLLTSIALAPALVERLLDRFEQHRIEWRTPRITRGLRVPVLLAVLLTLAVAGTGIAGYQRFASSEGQIRKLQALPMDLESYRLPDHPVFVRDRHYVWDNVDRYLDTLSRLDRAGALPDWVRKRCAEQLQSVPPGR